MPSGPELLLIGGVVAVGILHTMVPDHWLPIAILARQQGWSRGETAWAAARAGCGHVASTLVIGLAVWLGGAVFSERYGAAVDMASSVALVAFGGWIALAALRQLRGERPHSHRHDGHQHPHDDHPHRHDHPRWSAPALATATAAPPPTRHIHLHRHGDSAPHLHWHDHVADAAHPVWPGLELDPPPHDHGHQNSRSTALLLILGSSPMVEGLPAFFAAGKYGAGLIAAMALAFALSTIATYAALCVTSAAGLQLLRLGSTERYGEVLSGALIVTIGLAFGILAIG